MMLLTGGGVDQGRGVAQPGSASALGAEGRRFESCLPDHYPSVKNRNFHVCDACPMRRMPVAREDQGLDLLHIKVEGWLLMLSLFYIDRRAVSE